MNKYTIIDLFAGCGGMSIGFVNSGYKPIFAVEIDKDAANTYKNNIGSDCYVGDICELSDEEILRYIDGREVDVICAGFPCQGFSYQGKRDLNDPRNSLYKQVIRFARLIRPKIIVGENVQGLLSFDNGRTARNIINDFTDIGYYMEVKLLNAVDYGVAQYRKRAIFIGNNIGSVNAFPAPTVSTYKSAYDAIDTLPYYENMPEINHIISNHTADTVTRISMLGEGESLYNKYKSAGKRLFRNEPAPTMLQHNGSGAIHYTANRMLTVREMARLQSFDDSFIISGSTNSQRKQVCNAVPPQLAEAIASSILYMLN